MSDKPLDAVSNALRDYKEETDILAITLKHNVAPVSYCEALINLGFRAGWDYAMAAGFEVEEAGVQLAKFLEGHTEKLSCKDFAVVWYRMQAALAKGGK